MSDTGPKTCGAIVSNGAWAAAYFTAANLAAIDTSRATHNQQYTTFAVGVVKTFGLGVPAGATINGIKIDMSLSCNNAAGTAYNKIALSWNGGTNFTADSSEVSQAGTTDTSKAVGSSSDTWGRTWASTEFSDANFFIKVYGSVSSSSYNGRLTYLAVTVYYTAAAGPANLKTWCGLAKSSIKTIEGLAIASVKTYGGLA